ncbi:CRISPR/Cas system-associated exonuclease Cas4 (RecB family) [Rhodopirellula rubra]|uniref:CRISPR/Cas system-associated exonuclease Cas4 (RecB family) n=1 Tax=Aporhodopirellula rubra TaxID=980271 RepID=A0A7W5E2H7_9BACT|nr:PD-(D/E)XK nuclease family protein [Aporhodopirellula rubra]MBB3208920.1 CRISPR/Cas system-associated exonuclease Cas4 (RecB family) [Aporhodopirellula rubra]
MIQQTRLHIRLTPGSLRPALARTTINEVRGGPETLLRWLETQLGLPTLEAHRASHVTEYATALETVTDSVISPSLETDRWATASELLSRRDELQLSGWDQEHSDTLPDVVRDLATAADGHRFVFPSVSERLQSVLNALDDGQTLPEHTCILADSSDRWPVRWQRVLSRLTTQPIDEANLSCSEGRSLHQAQSIVRGGAIETIELDDSLRYVHTLSQSAAIEFVAATLAENKAELSRTIVVCEDDSLAMQLDGCLTRYGLPTMGASVSSPAHPVLQVLPLCLTLCWEPVDPQSLLDFLTLPICPIPRKAAVALAEALTEEPGLGSGAWEKTLHSLCSDENDPEGKLRERLDAWLFCDRVRRDSMISARAVRDRCALVAKWASGRAMLMADQDEPQELLVNALHVAAGQAALLGELVESQGSELSQPQLSRLLEEALSSGVESVGSIQANGGPVHVHSLAEITDACHRVIWLGLGTGDASACRWSADQLDGLRDSGIQVDDGTDALTSLRTAEARGLCFVEDALLAVLLPQDVEKRWHPIWLAIRTALSETARDNPPVLENLIQSNDVSSLTPFTFAIESKQVEAPQGLRPVWDIPVELLKDRETVSATELQSRLACPLKWVFSYQAKLHSSSIAQLPNEFQLKGSFCHKVLEYVFGDGDELTSVDDAVACVEQVFDERLPLDAAPFAQPDKYLDRQQLRKELSHATRVLVSTLKSGGYRIKGLEVDVRGEAFEKPFIGSIDCLAERESGEEAIVDFKYGGKKYEQWIAEGKAVQLATYAYSRSKEAGRFPAVAYLVLADGLFYTPTGGPVHGDDNRTVVEGPSIQAVWNEFESAISGAESWLTDGGLVPARPLQTLEEWPDGTRIVLETNLKATECQSVCKYCDYQHLCGLRQLL